MSETFLRLITEPHRSTARLVVLDPITFEPLGELSGADGYVLTGTVSMDRSRAVERTCTLQIANPGGAFTPRVLGDWLHVNSLLRLERGIYLDERSVEWCVLGHFLTGRPRVEVSAAGSVMSVDGEDRGKLLLRSRFTTPTTYAAGTRIAAIVRAEAELAGMGTSRYRLDDAGKSLAVARTFDEDANRMEVLRTLAQDFGLVLYADADGYLALTTPADPVAAPLAWSYTTSERSILLGITKEWTDDRLYNHVLVTGESSDPATPPVRAEAMDTNPSSPAYVNGPLGDRLYRYTSAMITTTAQAADVAAKLLPQVALIEEQISLAGVTNPALEPRDAIHISEALSATEGRYLVDQVQVPLMLGQQELGTRVARRLS